MQTHTIGFEIKGNLIYSPFRSIDSLHLDFGQVDYT